MNNTNATGVWFDMGGPDGATATEWECPECKTVIGVLFEEPWYTAEGGHPGDSGPGGNTPQEPVTWGTQTCHECKHQWEAEG